MMRTFSETVVAIGSSAELLVLVKATLAVGLGLAAVRIARSTRASVRHLLLTSTFGILLALPLAIALVPAVLFEIPTSSVTSVVATPAIPQINNSQTASAAGVIESVSATSAALILPSLQTILVAGWAIGIALFFAPFAHALWQLRRARRCGVPWLEARATLRTLAAEGGVHRSVEVLLDDRILAPVTCGWLRPAILLPVEAREWSELDLRRAFIHELEHIRRGDWMVHILARSICAVYWFHPLVWIAWRQLCLEAERACDDAVVEGAERTDYAEQLVALARRISQGQAQSALGMAKRSDLSARVSAVLDSSQQRGRAGLLAAATAISAASVVALAIAPLRAVARANNSTTPSTQESRSLGGQKRVSPLDRALLEAAEEGDTAEIERILSAGANINCAISGDGSPLIVAAREGRLATVRLLLDKGADPSMAVRGDGNALIMAAAEGHADVAELLLDRGASIDQMVPGDENPLIQASGNGKLAMVKLLVSHRADVNARAWVEESGNGRGEWRTPLSMARAGGHAEVVAFLLSAGATE